MTTDLYTTYHVTFEQVNACHRIVKADTHQVYYQVESSKNDGTEYIVVYNPIVKALTCNCKAGQNGIGCWHKRASLAHAAEYRAACKAAQEREQAQATAQILAEDLNPLAEDVQNERQAAKAEAQARKQNGNNAYNRKPFSFLR